MPQDRDDEHGAWVRRLRDQSRREAAGLVPRPDCQVYGLAAPALTTNRADLLEPAPARSRATASTWTRSSRGPRG